MTWVPANDVDSFASLTTKQAVTTAVTSDTAMGLHLDATVVEETYEAVPVVEAIAGIDCLIAATRPTSAAQSS